MILLQDVPNGYDYCFAGKDKCPKAATCLRAIAAQLLSESEDEQPETVRAVNPFYVERLPDYSSCGRYRSSEPLRYAKGMSRLFDEIPLKQVSIVRLRVMGCFSCERLLSLPQGRTADYPRRAATDSRGVQQGRDWYKTEIRQL